MSNFWHSKRVFISGAAGFLGSHLLEKIKAKEPADLFTPISQDYDLIKQEDVARAFDNFGEPCDIVLHLAARVGGIEANRKAPGALFYQNLMPGVNLIEEARKRNVKKFVTIGSVCSYPKFSPVPFKEENLWDGYPEETNAPYGLAKKALLVQGQAYRKEYDLNVIHFLLVNLYGPRDNFDPNTSHVIPALIKRFYEARKDGKKEVAVWGTGKASREFLFVEDAAEAILLAAEYYDKSDPINVGAGFEITIRDLVSLIADEVGFEGGIIWDRSKSDGQPRRCLDVSKAKKEFNFKAKVSFHEGLRKTINWYCANF